MSAYSTIIKKFGIPDNTYQSKYCELWNIKEDFDWFPADKIFINSEFKKKLFVAFTAIEKAGLQNQIKTFDGCYNPRSVRGSSVLSLHAYAMAIDLNAGIEKLGQETTKWSEQFIEIMKAQGIFWGGDYINRKDPMHFGLYDR